MYQRILVATDGSSLSKKAVTNAIQLAATCGAELVAMKVVPVTLKPISRAAFLCPLQKSAALKSNGQKRPRPAWILSPKRRKLKASASSP